MTPANRLLGVPVLATGFLSLLLWLYIAVRIVTGVRGNTDIDFYAPVINGVPFFNFLNTGMIAFVLSFTCMVLYLTFWWRNSPKRSLASRFVRASLLTTWFYSLLLFCYLAARVVINQASINSPFINALLPWLTFLRLGIIAFILGLLSFLAYLALFWRSDHGLAAERSS